MSRSACPLQDSTVVAGAAERALLEYIRSHPDALSDLLSGSSPAAKQLEELTSSSSSTHRMRAFALLVQAAASSSSHAQQLRQAGETGAPR
jgi:hypothetical protein